MSCNIEDINDLPFFKVDHNCNHNSNAADIYTQLHPNSCSRSKYSYIDNIPTDVNDLYTILTLNIRSIPTNLQTFTDSVLCNVHRKNSILSFTETRLSPHLASLY